MARKCLGGGEASVPKKALDELVSHPENARALRNVVAGELPSDEFESLPSLVNQ